jgi:membrane protein required for colicin V production
MSEPSTGPSAAYALECVRRVVPALSPRAQADDQVSCDKLRLFVAGWRHSAAPSKPCAGGRYKYRALSFKGETLNWVDAVILATLAWFTYAAFNAGLIREVITILGAVFAVALAGLFYSDLAKDIDVAVKNSETSRLIAFAIVFGATILATQLLAIFLKQAASLLLLGLFDSLGGAVIGLIKGFIFVEIALIIGVTFQSLHLNDDINRSTLAPFFLDVLPILTRILPAEFKNAVDAF